MLLLAPLFCSCFTGVEGTSKINLSKKDIVAYAPTKEESFLEDIRPLTLGEWSFGKQFRVTDEKFRLVVEGAGASLLQVGDIVRFVGAQERKSAGGGVQTIISFATNTGQAAYIVDRPLNNLRETFTSLELPMLTDMDMVEDVRKKLKGMTVWTRTALWYDDSLQYQRHRKFVPVKIEEIEPGNSFFPVLVKFKDERGERGSLLMNIGNTGNESRTFGKLFSLSDPRFQYKNVRKENWETICLEEVTPGMTKEECRLSKGNPKDIDTGHNYSSAMEIWYYPDGSYLRFIDGILTGGKQM